jgi:hypothetical protein
MVIFRILLPTLYQINVVFSVVSSAEHPPPHALFEF